MDSSGLIFIYRQTAIPWQLLDVIGPVRMWIKIYDFKDPLSLPLRELKEIELLDNDEVITGWKDNHTLTTKGVKREREIEKFEGGSQRMKVISETPIEREITV
jgi:hypothetical protein